MHRYRIVEKVNKEGEHFFEAHIKNGIFFRFPILSFWEGLWWQRITMDKTKDGVIKFDVCNKPCGSEFKTFDEAKEIIDRLKEIRKECAEERAINKKESEFINVIEI